jgi:hypothetical protein
MNKWTTLPCEDPECIKQENRPYSRRQLLPTQDPRTTTGSQDQDPIIDDREEQHYPPLPYLFTGENPFGNRGVFDDGMTGGRKKYRKSSKKSKRKSSKKSKRKSSKKAIKLSRR